MTGPEIRAIPALQTRSLRERVLRPGQSADELEYPRDDAADTRHFGAYLGNELVGVASIYRELQPDAQESVAWRLRGMATDTSVRRTGIGGALVEACKFHVANLGGTRIWCNARSSAVGFYLALGFRAEGREFELPGIGTHVLMWRPVSRPGDRQAAAERELPREE